jgi:hypothetical protein
MKQVEGICLSAMRRILESTANNSDDFCRTLKRASARSGPEKKLSVGCPSNEAD